MDNDLAATDVAGGETVASDNGSEASQSMEDTIRQTLAAQNQTNDEQETQAAATESRVRGSDGKFVTKPATEQAVVQPDQAQQAAPVAPKPHDAVPSTWKKEFAGEFGKLPEPIKQEIHRREQDMLKGIGQYKEAAGFGQQIAQELLPFQQQIQAAGIHPREVVKTLLPAWNTLANGSPQDKANLVLQLVRDYSIDFATLGTDSEQSTAQRQEDPRLSAALQRLEKIEGNLTAQERQRAEADYAQNNDLVNRFMADPANEHANAVRGEMAALFYSGQAADLKEAYNKAIWINDDVRGSLLAKQEKERMDKAAKEAAAARKAAGANVTRRGQPPVKPTAGTMEDTIRSTYRGLNGG